MSVSCTSVRSATSDTSFGVLRGLLYSGSLQRVYPFDCRERPLKGVPALFHYRRLEVGSRLSASAQLEQDFACAIIHAVPANTEAARLISARCQRLKPSPTLAITSRARRLKTEGLDIVSFGAGEPDFDTPDYIKNAAIDALRDGFTKYTASTGIPELKSAIARKLREENGLDYAPSQIVVSVGAKHAIYNSLMALCNPGDEVIIIAPYWVSYPEQVQLAGGTPVCLTVTEATDFVPTIVALESTVTDRTKAIIINSPGNPTGVVYPEATLRQIGELAAERDLWIITDEIYEKIVYDGRTHRSIASLSREIGARTVTVNGLSKSHSMTGWRIGYAAAPPDVASAMSNLQDQMTSNPVSFAQVGAVAALEGDSSFVTMMREAFDERRRFLTGALNGIAGVHCAQPHGAFFTFPNVKALFGRSSGDRTIRNCDDLAEYLLEAAQAAVVPGSGFGAPENLRLSYAIDLPSIRRGIERIGEAIAKLR